ncbi:MAG: thiosulfate/3-mercaptopyruvate sulfurtransferase [Betaproteobacteria bacterium]|nr:thiosulfate/3-mercaptopyruvate sulfurtransferase [Betaproteobacteria bacterium]
MRLWKQVAATTLAWGLAAASALAQALPGPVVNTAWLAANLDKVQVLDLRGSAKSFTTDPEFDEVKGKKVVDEVGGHIAGSRLMEFKTIRVEREINGNKVKYMVPERAVFEKMVQDAGIDGDKPIVIVPVGLSLSDVNDGMRLYWQFKLYGEDKVAMLDGGMAAWLQEGRPYVKDALVAKVGNWKSAADRTVQLFADSTDVADIVEKKSAQLIDGRELPQFHGLMKRDYVYAYGHIDTAKPLSPDTTYKKDGSAIKLLSANTYRGVLQAQGIDPAAPSVVYCNSGAQSSLPWFILSEVLGNHSAKQFDGSLHQWTLEKRPLVGAVSLN